MKHVVKILVLAILCQTGVAWATEKPKDNKLSNHWLLDEKDQTKRLEKLEKYLRGFDQPMLEVASTLPKPVSGTDR